MHTSLQLLPTPQEITFFPGSHLLTDEWLIHLDGQSPQALRFAAERFQSSLHSRLSLNWEIAAGTPPTSLIDLTLRIDPEQVKKPRRPTSC